MPRLLLASVLAFVAVVPWGPWVVRQLLARGVGKQIRHDGPATHQTKAGTATMGGLYILAGVCASAAVLAAMGYTRPLLLLGVMLAFGALGAIDDLRGLRDAQGVGWLARSKFPWQWAVALALATVLFLAEPTHLFIAPGARHVRVELGGWFIPLATVALVVMSNAVNLTDGLDGLATGNLSLAFGAYGVLLWAAGHRGLDLFCFALVGVLLAFLWYNAHPARVFMGDTGSEALGAGLAAVALLSGHCLLMLVIGAVFIAEALSVIVQVSYFKYTRRKLGEGKRVFRMAPLHHHFEQCGLSEVQITTRLWLAGAMAAALGVAIGLVGTW